MRKSMILLAILSASAAVPVFAAETIAYSYDAKGRLIKTVRTGTVNNGVQTTYAHDKANNRKTKKITGAP
jgi:hypothetical protein